MFQEQKQKILQKRENLVHARLKKSDPERLKKTIPLPEDKYIPSIFKIKINPSLRQKRTINDWIAAYRKTWNLCLRDIEMESKNKCNEVFLRNKYIIQKNMSEENLIKYKWLFRTGKRIREYGLKDLLSSYESCKTRFKNKQINKFNIGYKSKYDKKQTIVISHESTYFLPKTKKLKTNGLEIPISEIPSGLDIKKDKIKLDNNLKLMRINGDYYIYITHYPEIKEREYKTEKIVSIDPGIDVFGTFYSPQGEWGEIGKDFDKKLEKKRNKIRKIKDGYINFLNLTKVKGVEMKKKKIISKIKRKITNLVDDFHWKVIHWLLKNYDEIVIPRLYVQKGNKLKEKQADLRHCQFVDRLIYKSMFYGDKDIYEVKEHWTSKTCTRCGFIDYKLGSSKKYKCGECKLEIGRDLNGARNILIKHLN
jgi:transposase